MEIENASNWNTQDLLALVEAVRNLPNYKQGHYVWPETLLLFRTSRKKDRKDRSSGEVWSKAPPVSYSRSNTGKYLSTITVSIAATSKLELEVLEKLAHIHKHGEQHMSSENVMDVAKAIAEAIGPWDSYKWDFSWAAKYSMRVRTDKPRTPIAHRRRLAALESQRTRMINKHYEVLKKLDKEIHRAEEKVKKHST